VEMWIYEGVFPKEIEASLYHVRTIVLVISCTTRLQTYNLNQ